MGDNEDFELIPLIHDILKSYENDSHDVIQKVAELKDKFTKAKEKVEQLPGIDCTKEEQERKVEILRQQLVRQTELLKKYKEWDCFESS